MLAGDLSGTNREGVPHILPSLMVLFLLIVATSIDTSTVFGWLLAATWLLGAGAYGRVPLLLAGWWCPPVEVLLVIVVPATLCLGLKLARHSRHRPVVAFAVALVAVEVASYAAPWYLPRTPDAVALVAAVVYTSTAALACLSAAYLRRST